MQFQKVRDAIERTLNYHSGCRYQVIGYQVQAAGSTQRMIPTVSVYFSSGNFPKSGGSIAGEKKHDISFRLEFTAAVQPRGDLRTLQDDTATALQLSRALSTFQIAAREADRILDQLISDVHGVLTDARNEHFGLAVGDLSGRWVDSINKDSPTPRGETVLLTGSAQLTCTVCESVLGDAGIAGDDYNVTIDLDGDDTEQTGTAGTLGG